MSESVVTDLFRRKLAAHMAGTAVLKPIALVAFGDGGHRADNTAKPTSSGAVGLFHEVLRKPVSAITQEGQYTATGKGIISSGEISSGVISEAGLFDESGNLLCWKSFAPKYLESGESYGVNLTMRF